MEMIEGVVCVWVLRRRKNRSGWWRRKDGGRSKRRDGEMGDGFWEQRDGGRWKGGDDGEMVVSLGLGESFEMEGDAVFILLERDEHETETLDGMHKGL